MKRFRILKALRIVLFVVGAATILGYAIMALWNAVLPAIAGFHAITFAQALGLLLLSRILFGGLRGRGRRGWRGRIHRHWRQMSPEEREQMRSRMSCGAARRRCDAAPPTRQS